MMELPCDLYLACTISGQTTTRAQPKSNIVGQKRNTKPVLRHKAQVEGIKEKERVELLVIEGHDFQFSSRQEREQHGLYDPRGMPRRLLV
jgi:hypothetical protein